MEGVRQARGATGIDIDLWILSAGYGLILGSQEIVPYECTFQGMKTAELREWAAYLQVP